MTDKSLELVEAGNFADGERQKGFVHIAGHRTEKKKNTLQFELSFTVKAKKAERVILKNAADALTSGTALAIMGPSGAGKTSLLRALTMEAHGGKTVGKILLNGEPMTAERFARRCAIVEQEDHHWAMLTCRETISYAADLYLNVSAAEKKQAVDEMLQKMGLVSCADALCGNPFIKGLSGGQKRRLSLAVVMMKDVDVIFLDEVTSGLDAASAAGIMTFIDEITKSEGLISIYTIHQPSTSIYNRFDRVMLLSEGRIAYCGSRENVNTYFASINYPVPEATNPAEFLLDLVNKDFSDESRVKDILDQWLAVGQDNHTKTIDQIVVSSVDSDYQSERLQDASVGFFSQIVTMFSRHFKLAFKDPSLYIGRMIMFLICTIFFGIIYIDARKRNQEQALQRMWYIVWCIGVPSNCAVAAVYAYNVEFHAIKREVKNGMVSPLSYLLATTIIQLPMMVGFGLFAISVGMYGMIDFVPSHYAQMLLLYSCLMLSFESIAQLLAVASDNPLIGMLNYMQLWFASFLFCGLFVQIKDIVWPFRLFSYILPLRYALRSMGYQEFIGRDFDDASLCDPKKDVGCLSHGSNTGSDEGWICDSFVDGTCYGRTGKQVLATLSDDFKTFTDEDKTLDDVLILLAIAVACKLMYMSMMYFKVNSVSQAVDPDSKSLSDTLRGALSCPSQSHHSVSAHPSVEEP